MKLEILTGTPEVLVLEVMGSVPGPQGDQGDAATLDVGTVTVVNPDQPPNVVNSGDTGDAIFDFDLPRAAEISIGTVTTVEPLDPATVTDSGTDGDVVLDFQIPRGEQGIQGESGIIERRHEYVEPIIYAGTAPDGTLDSATSWTLTKITLNEQGGFVSRETATDSWNNRLTATYG
jgi:hypothetical protein